MSREPTQIDADVEGALYGEEDLLQEKQGLSLSAFSGSRKAKRAVASRAQARPAAPAPQPAAEPTAAPKVEPAAEEPAPARSESSAGTPDEPAAPAAPATPAPAQAAAPTETPTETPSSSKTKTEIQETDMTEIDTTKTQGDLNDDAARAAAPVTLAPATPVPATPVTVQAPSAAPAALEEAAPEAPAINGIAPSAPAQPQGDMDVALSRLGEHMRNSREDVKAFEALKARAVPAMALGGEAAGIQAAINSQAEPAPEAVEVGDYDPDLTRAEANEAAAMDDACIVSCGDPHQPVEPPLSPAEQARRKRLAAMNFPDRPADWPPMMQWPSARDLDILERHKGNQKMIDAYAANLMDMNVQMRRRADQMRGFLDSHREQMTLREFIARQRKIDGKRLWRPDEVVSLGAAALTRHALPRIATGAEDPRDRDPQRGIKFALMLDPSAIGANSHLVASWSEDKIRTLCGCNVYATNSDITFRMDPRYRDRQTGIPDDAITLSIREGKSRGWKHFDVQGTKRFARAFEKKAMEEGISATIRYRNKFGRMVTIQVAPIVPGVNDQAMQWQPKIPAAQSPADPAREASADPAPAAPQAADQAAGVPGLAPMKTSAAFSNMKTMQPPAPAADAPTEAAARMKIEPATASAADRKKEIAADARELDKEIKAALGEDLDHSPAPQMA